MTRVLLIRHAVTDSVGRYLVGRSPGVRLNELGQEQARRLPERIRGFHLDGVYSSPLERARQTAEPLAQARRLDVHILEELQELDYGDWQGAEIAALDGEPYWTRYNRLRSLCRIPDGEALVEAQARMMTTVQDLCARQPAATVALVGHGDPLKTLIAGLLGMPLDFVHRLQLDPASVSGVDVDDAGPRFWSMNCNADLPDPSAARERS